MPSFEFLGKEIPYNEPLDYIRFIEGVNYWCPEYCIIERSFLEEVSKLADHRGQDYFIKFLRVGIDYMEKVKNKSRYIGDKRIMIIDLNPDELEKIANTERFINDIIEVLTEDEIFK